MRAFRGVAPPGVPLSLAYAAGGATARPVPPGIAWMDLEPAPRGVALVAAWSLPATPRPVRAAFRRLAFERLEVDLPAGDDDAMVTTVLDGRPGIEVPLAVRLPAPPLARVVVPRHALHFVSRPGTVAPDPEGDTWESGQRDAGPLALELVPRTLVLRNAAFAWTRPYLYRPNPGAVVLVTGLAALTLVLVRRSRPTGAEDR
jgi:hypothetical protein